MVLLRGGTEKKIKGNMPDNHDSIVGEADSQTEGYYAAVDIGTTTLSIDVYDQDGKYIGGCAENNAQGQLGSDVMMRLMHASEGRQEKLHIMIKDQIYQLLGQILADTEERTTLSDADNGAINSDKAGQLEIHSERDKAGQSKVYYERERQGDDRLAYLRKVSVVGNTVMCHLFLNKDTTGLRGTPFHTAYQGSYRLYGKDLGWSACSEAEVVVLPGIAVHVGADAAAVFMAEQLWQENRIQLAIDLGTNAEILLNCRGQLWVCSAAAGPAFEGKGISCGCRGGAGAISAVKLNRANGNILLDVVPEPVSGILLPKGICGSGLVDLIAELLENKLLQPDGYLLSQMEAKELGIHHLLAGRLEERNGETRFSLYE
ncbi:MAG: ASKHA domain-containing protein, partial [Lachnospiraceae bacterium]|nr:ASKHA domain-containing protein [Lachnospiraceae bacterium]